MNILENINSVLRKLHCFNEVKTVTTLVCKQIIFSLLWQLLKLKFFFLMRFLCTAEVVSTTSSTTCAENFVKMMTFLFQWNDSTNAIVSIVMNLSFQPMLEYIAGYEYMYIFCFPKWTRIELVLSMSFHFCPVDVSYVYKVVCLTTFLHMYTFLFTFSHFYSPSHMATFTYTWLKILIQNILLSHRVVAEYRQDLSQWEKTLHM